MAPSRQSVAAAAAVAGLLAGGVLAGGPDVPPAAAFSPEQKLLAEVWRIVDDGYVDRTFNGQDWFKIRTRAVKAQYANQEAGYAAVRKMLASLNDPYTRFLTPPQYTSLTAAASGSVAGVGVTFFPARVDGELVIAAPVDGSPAARGGVQPGDVLLEIDGEDLSGLTPDDAAARVRGPPGSEVSLAITHPGPRSSLVRLDLVREVLKLPSVVAELVSRPPSAAEADAETTPAAPVPVGLIRVKGFTSSTAEDVGEAVADLRSQGAKAWVVDLRNNPGGYFPGGVDVARLFLPVDTPIVYVVDRHGVVDEIDTIRQPAVPTTDRVVVLVNRATASASEILAGALKENGRAVLVGERTFGKGVVQTVSPLSDGSGVAVTIARYETPGHKDINKKGIDVDVAVECAADAAALACVPESVL